MKNFIYLLGLGICFLSCNKEDFKQKLEPSAEIIGFKTVTQPQKIARYRESYLPDNPRDFEKQEGIIIDIGRKSRNCNGFGICIIRTSLIRNEPPNAMVQKELDNTYLILELDRELDTELYDSTLYVEENLKFNNTELPSGEYSLDKSIGEFGGYKLKLSSKK
ncbi:MAG: hypothetical protein KGV59_05855 [Tenacibaculum sp.]|nr:hypothetical protein [Tenacibaculum sp.]